MGWLDPLSQSHLSQPAVVRDVRGHGLARRPRGARPPRLTQALALARDAGGIVAVEQRVLGGSLGTPGTRRLGEEVRARGGIGGRRGGAAVRGAGARATGRAGVHFGKGGC